MSKSLSDGQKLKQIGIWLGVRMVIVAGAISIIKGAGMVLARVI